MYACQQTRMHEKVCPWVAGSAPPDLPMVMVNWHDNKTMNITPVHISQLPQTWEQTQVNHSARSAAWHAAFPHNVLSFMHVSLSSMYQQGVELNTI